MSAGASRPEGDGRMLRLAEVDRAPIDFRLDGQVCQALTGDTILTGVLTLGKVLRQQEFGPEGRAGFCLMGACQDCWIWQEDGVRLRACSTPLVKGMRLLTATPHGWR